MLFILDGTLACVTDGTAGTMALEEGLTTAVGTRFPDWSICLEVPATITALGIGGLGDVAKDMAGEST